MVINPTTMRMDSNECFQPFARFAFQSRDGRTDVSSGNMRSAEEPLPMSSNDNHQLRNREPLNQVFKILSHPIRRWILTELTDQRQLSVEEVATGEFESAIETYDSLLVVLNHSHLPALDEASYIDWNNAANTIRRGSRFEEIRPFLELLNDHQNEIPGNWP